MNVNGNKYLSLADVDKGIIDVWLFNLIFVIPIVMQVLGLEEVFDCKRAVNEAFHFTKSSSPVKIHLFFMTQTTIMNNLGRK